MQGNEDGLLRISERMEREKVLERVERGRESLAMSSIREGRLAVRKY